MLWLRGEDPGWDTSSFWPRGENAGRIPKCCGVVQIPVGTPQVLWLRGENPGRIALVTECCGFVAKIPVGIPQVLWLRGENPGRIPQVLWLRGEDPGWDTSSFSSLSKLPSIV